MGNDPESVEVDEKLRVLGGVVENGKLTRLGVILAGAKESVLNTPEIKEIVENRKNRWQFANAVTPAVISIIGTILVLLLTGQLARP